MKYLIKCLNGIGIGIVVCVIVVLLPLTVPKLFGYEIYGILSQSMEPEIASGSVIYVKDIAPEDVEVGDVITFKMSAKSDVVATHRVVEVLLDEKAFVTKGDNNDAVDSSPVSFDRLLGITVFSLPYLGELSILIYSVNGIAGIVIAFAIAIFCWILADYLKNKNIRVT